MVEEAQEGPALAGPGAGCGHAGTTRRGRARSTQEDGFVVVDAVRSRGNRGAARAGSTARQRLQGRPARKEIRCGGAVQWRRGRQEVAGRSRLAWPGGLLADEVQAGKARRRRAAADLVGDGVEEASSDGGSLVQNRVRETEAGRREKRRQGRKERVHAGVTDGRARRSWRELMLLSAGGDGWLDPLGNEGAMGGA